MQPKHENWNNYYFIVSTSCRSCFTLKALHRGITCRLLLWRCGSSEDVGENAFTVKSCWLAERCYHKIWLRTTRRSRPCCWPVVIIDLWIFHLLSVFHIWRCFSSLLGRLVQERRGRFISRCARTWTVVQTVIFVVTCSICHIIYMLIGLSAPGDQFVSDCREGLGGSSFRRVELQASHSLRWRRGGVIKQLRQETEWDITHWLCFKLILLYLLWKCIGWKCQIWNYMDYTKCKMSV